VRETINIIKEAVSGSRMLNSVAEITSFHRIQGSTGFRAAANFCADKLRKQGIESKVRSYAADGKTWYLSSKIFKEWDCKEAYCDLVSPKRKRLADFSADNISIIQRSYPCDYRNQALDVVLLDKGPDEAAYGELDLKAKMIFVRTAFLPYMEWAVEKRGAVGIITDFMRPLEAVRNRYDLFDVLNYTSFWWKYTEREGKAFGFVLTPREGGAFAELCVKMREEHAKDPSKDPYPKVSCYVSSSIYDGTIENVETVLNGKTDEEILIVAHLCHPRASANDNASGVAAGMEVIKILKSLTDSGKLPPLKRKIRMLFVPEFTGTYAFLDELGEGRKKILAGINLDMVGGRQTTGYGPIMVMGLPRAMPSFVTDLAALILDEVKKDVAYRGGNESGIALFNSQVMDFSGGSDHLVLSDPTIGIPTLMLGQSPDLNYHTAADTLDKVDPFILKKSASLAAAYVYALSNLSAADLPLIFNKSRERLVSSLAWLNSNALEGVLKTDGLYEEAEQLKRFALKSCDDYRRFFSGAELEKADSLIKEEQAYIRPLFSSLLERYLKDSSSGGFSYVKPETPALYACVPIRKYKSPIQHLEDYALNDERLFKAFKDYDKGNRTKLSSSHESEALIQYYMDGERTAFDIARELWLEIHDGSPEIVYEYLRLLELYGLIEIKPGPQA